MHLQFQMTDLGGGASFELSLWRKQVPYICNVM